MDPSLAARVRDADLILAVGSRLGDVMTRGYTLLVTQTLVHVHPDPAELGRIFEPELGICSCRCCCYRSWCRS